MGGAERSARKRRQQGGTPGSKAQSKGAKAVAAARSNGDRNKMIIGAIVVVLLAGAVIGGVIYTNSQKNKTEDQTIALQTATNHQVVREGPVVVVGKPDAKVTVDIYEDFLCPGCGAFEKRNGEAIDKKVGEGAIKVRYHMMPMLSDASDPPGYSADSSNAALCAADAGQFPSFHKSLFAAQPEEGARGYDKGQLIGLGKRAGITDGAFESCVNSGKYNQIAAEDFQKASKAPELQRESSGRKGFFSPTVAVNNKVVETGDSGWLDRVASGAA
ncbi:protein-disulfide isomerase [Herbihabitans rhizosphaerae]|uniref:Protein-disulfide isomerase n=1 Tax=Herbihabitans rhizosphaerae TaxID=1872711 RepID=A0A4Q7KDQ8_9PSEU|nr:thioredoxin domain-containing protein [Herbihabitans rhizosphaerae]RZS32171.1 protein-disulfide isomerase [Herbihabitans rhizosphaerae]